MINYLEKNNINIDSIKNKSILKTQQRFKGEMHNVFTKEINKISSSLMMLKKCNQWIIWNHMHMEQAKM